MILIRADGGWIIKNERNDKHTVYTDPVSFISAVADGMLIDIKIESAEPIFEGRNISTAEDFL